jgi:CspA family cold shock protein
MATGTVQRYDTARGFGTITPDDGSALVFVHQSALGRLSYAGLAAGQRVDFDAELGPKGPRARTVRSA